MRPHRLAQAVALAATSLALPVLAEEPSREATPDLDSLVLDTGRPKLEPTADDRVRLLLHGEYQLRGTALSSVPMTATASARAAQPGLLLDSTGQNGFANHWLRVTPRLQIKKLVEIVAQADVLTGMVAGQLAHDVHPDRTPRDSYDGFRNVQPRWLYAQIETPVGLVRVGQQPNHWGMGLLAHDGDHPSVFGDYRYGQISERILFATKPGGRDSEVVVALAGDMVYRDNFARLSEGDRAFQGVLATYWERGLHRVGFFGTARTQSTDRTSSESIHRFSDELDVFAADLHAKTAAKLPSDEAYLFGEAEVAAISGTSNVLRTGAMARDGEKTAIRSWGGAVIGGVAFTRARGAPTTTQRKDTPPPARFGSLVAQLELGYASGDANPHDGTERRFTFDPNHRVGLLMFDELVRWQTARAAAAASDPLLANGERPPPGIGLLPSQGGVVGAQYVNPTVIVRPRPSLDLKAGAVIAQTTADFVDPYRITAEGAYRNYRGGSPKKHDLGLEVDGGVEWRLPLEYALTLVLGAQGGVLFPGGAFEDARGARPQTQWITVARAGLLF